MEFVTEKAFHSQQESKPLWRRIPKLGMSPQNKRVFVFKRSPIRLLKSCGTENNKKDIRIKIKKTKQNNKTVTSAGTLNYSRKPILNSLSLDFAGQTRIMPKVSQLFNFLRLLNKHRSFNLLHGGYNLEI